MYTLQSEAEFDSAHRLEDYTGKCSRLHGHRWKIVVKVSGSTLNEWGGLTDFGDIKSALKEVEEDLDHRVILKDTEYNKSFNFPKDWVVWLPYNPSSENLAKYIFERLSDSLNNDLFHVSEVTVFETPKGACTYKSDLEV